MQPTVYLHIGIPKTGTSAIQRMFSRNAYYFRNNDILYPESFRFNHAHFELSDLFGFGESIKEGGETRPDDLLAEIERSQCRKIVLSSENFVRAGDWAGLKNLLSSYTIKIIVYLRKLDEWWASAYQQSVRQSADVPWGSGFEDFYRYLESRPYKYWHYMDLLERWSEIFGKYNMIIRPFAREQKSIDVREDFLQLIGYDTENNTNNLRAVIANSNELDQNESYCGEAIYFLELAKNSKVSPPVMKKIINYASRMQGTIRAKHLIDSERLNTIARNAEAEYEDISLNYLNGKKLFAACNIYSHGPPYTMENNEILSHTAKALLK